MDKDQRNFGCPVGLEEIETVAGPGPVGDVERCAGSEIRTEGRSVDRLAVDKCERIRNVIPVGIGVVPIDLGHVASQLDSYPVLDKTGPK